MKLSVIDYGHNSDLPASVTSLLTEEDAQTKFRSVLNSALSNGKSEMTAFLQAWKTMQDLGYEASESGPWVKKESPTVGDVHVDQPIGAKKKPKQKDDPDADPADVEEFEEEGQRLKVYVPPVELQAAAKSALALSRRVPGITELLAKGAGLPLADIRAIADHFGTEVPDPDPLTRDAWGGALAAKWAGRVIKKSGTVAKKQQYESFELFGAISKVDTVQHQVFGWASIVSVNGIPVTDTQGDQITEETIEAAAYDFVLTARVAGEMHQDGSDGTIRPVGGLIESVVFTPQKVASMLQSLKVQNIDAIMQMPFCGWWIGFQITDEDVWQKVVSGDLKAFSIGGRGKRDKVS